MIRITIKHPPVWDEFRNKDATPAPIVIEGEDPNKDQYSTPPACYSVNDGVLSVRVVGLIRSFAAGTWVDVTQEPVPDSSPR